MEINSILNDFNTPYYDSDVVKILRQLQDIPMATSTIAFYLTNGEINSTRKLMKHLEDCEIVKGEKNSLNEYMWSLTEYGFAAIY